ncbi:MAG: cupin [Alphaproteobacteria bacterium]|nr:cupin [Alphaproteobacteria bacterium]
MGETNSIECVFLTESDGMPNNDKLPLIRYRAAVDLDDEEPESVFEKTFAQHGWGNGFRGDTFPFHHYHSVAHEVVGFARGRAEIQFGGPAGPIHRVQAGDAVVIPAGVGHRRLDETPGFSSVGAYPPGQSPDLCVMSESDARIARQRPDMGNLEVSVIGEKELQAARASITGTALPLTDPIRGNSGPIMTLWRDR